MPDDVIRPDRTTHCSRLLQGFATGHVTRAELDQHIDFYHGLENLTPGHSPITQRLWAGLWLPLGIERTEEKKKE